MQNCFLKIEFLLHSISLIITIYIVETKGREDLDDIEKIKRLEQWCEDASERQKKIAYKMLYVKQEEWDKYKPTSFKQLAEAFKK